MPPHSPHSASSPTSSSSASSNSSGSNTANNMEGSHDHPEALDESIDPAKPEMLEATEQEEFSDTELEVAVAISSEKHPPAAAAAPLTKEEEEEDMLPPPPPPLEEEENEAPPPPLDSKASTSTGNNNNNNSKPKKTSPVCTPAIPKLPPNASPGQQLWHKMQARLASRTTVKFAPRIQVTQIPHINNLPDDVIDNTWYAPLEYKQIKRNFADTVRGMMNGTLTEDVDDHCLRGLEHRTKLGAKMRSQTKLAALIAVLDEQDRQIELGIYDEESLCKEYQMVSLRSVHRSLVLAKKDREVVNEIYREMEEEEEDQEEAYDEYDYEDDESQSLEDCKPPAQPQGGQDPSFDISISKIEVPRLEIPEYLPTIEDNSSSSLSVASLGSSSDEEAATSSMTENQTPLVSMNDDPESIDA